MKEKRNKNIRIGEFSNAELLNMDIIEIYKLLLEGRIRRFPPGIWECPEAKENSIRCIKYLLEDILQWNIEDIKSNIRMKVFIKYKLSGMMQKLYGNSPYEALSLVYPNQFMPWELHEAPTRIWLEKENRILAMDWLINTKLKWTDEDIIMKYNNQILIDNNLGGLLSEGGKGSAFSLLDEYMPGKFQPWELEASMSSINYWKNKENRVNAIKNMIENVLKWDENQVKNNLSQKTFKEHRLSGLFYNYYNGSPYQVLEEVYPQKYLPWELSCSPLGYWDIKENRIKAVKWIFETKLKWSIDDIKKNVSQNIFKEYGLASLLGKQKGGLYTIISEAYPNQIEEWELPFTSNLYWQNKDNRIKALNYLFNDVLKWSTEDIKKNISQKIFLKNGLNGLLKYYNGSPYQILKEYLPNEDIKPWELPVAPNGLWQDKNNCIEAMEWMIKEFNITLDNINKVTREFLEKNKLYSIVSTQYNNSMSAFQNDLIDIIKSQI